MKRALITAVCGAALIAVPTVAFAQDTETGGVAQADATTACAAIVDEEAPSDALIAGFRAAYNTVDNTDDGPASVGLSPDWQRLIYLQELHVDYLGLAGLGDTASFTCDAGVAVFADLTLAEDVADAVCAEATLTVEDITDADLRARVVAALEVLGVSFDRARADCDAPDETTPPVTTPPAIGEGEDTTGGEDATGDDDLLDLDLPNAAPRPVIVSGGVPVTG